MRFRFVVDGAAYSEHKDAFKGILRRHGLAFRGTRETFVWSSRSESVTAVYERDEARDVTLRAELVWQSRKKTPLLNELKEWVWSVGGHGGEEEEDAAAGAKASDAVERELATWDAVHRPDAERLRADGRPEAWIERDVKAWRRKRAEKKRELLGRLHPD
jgi:hypothetical protein